MSAYEEIIFQNSARAWFSRPLTAEEIKKTGASFARGSSVQEVGTPDDFLIAFERRFGKIAIDLAADEFHTVTHRYLDRRTNSLAQPWHQIPGMQWLNPEFDDLDTWAEKCSDEGQIGAQVAMLSPASIGTNWFAHHAFREAVTIGIRPRLIFKGSTAGYPKDLCLTLWGMGFSGFGIWDYKRDVTEWQARADLVKWTPGQAANLIAPYTDTLEVMVGKIHNPSQFQQMPRGLRDAIKNEPSPKY